VKTHLRSIYRKLGVNDRAGAVAPALREGIFR
jgi:DNA-binding CsgD family transcriptional regulator